MGRVLFSFDTEDFVTPESDDALKGIAQTLERRGIRASFAMVGCKARALWTRCRKDVIEAVKRHDVQYHANTHMMWPQTTLYMSRMRWDEGLDLVVNTERHGIEDVSEVFDARPMAYVRCGGNWDPREIYGMSLLGIREYVPSIYLLRSGAPVWFDNVLNGRYDFPIERYFQPEITLDDMKREFVKVMEQTAESTLPIVACAHPTMFRTSKWYDHHNQERRGVFPEKSKWKPAPLLEPKEFRRRLSILDQIVKFVTSIEGMTTETHSDVIRRHQEPARWLTRGQLRGIARNIRKDFDYQRLGTGYLSAADVFGALSLALTRWKYIGTIAPTLPVRRIIGPPEPTGEMRSRHDVSLSELAAACGQVEREIDTQHRMPGFVRIAGRRIPPSTFLMAMADAFEVIMSGRKRNVVLKPQPLFPRCKDEVCKVVRASSSELPEDFQLGNIVTYTHQQTWTIRPAIARAAS